jgi:hypothetical protein
MQQFPSVTTEPTLLSGWRISGPAWQYLLYCVLVTLIVRAILCFFKALAIGSGEHLDGSERTSENETMFLRRFWMAFSGFSGHKNVRDYWLPAIIGFCEAASYPVLIILNQNVIIGGWLAIKTAGQWKVWQSSRTAFNRFLVGNLLVLAFSYFWLLSYLSK